MIIYTSGIIHTSEECTLHTIYKCNQKWPWIEVWMEYSVDMPENVRNKRFADECHFQEGPKSSMTAALTRVHPLELVQILISVCFRLAQWHHSKGPKEGNPYQRMIAQIISSTTRWRWDSWLVLASALSLSSWYASAGRCLVSSVETNRARTK